MDVIYKDLTNLDQLIDDVVQKRQETEYKQQQVIEWYASEGLIFYNQQTNLPDKRPTLTRLASQLNISRQTIYDWSKTIPDFTSKVTQYRQSLINANVTSVWNATYLSALKGNIEAIRLYLSTFDTGFIDPRSTRHQKAAQEPSVSFTNLIKKHGLAA